jgi:hypothetical protein
MREIDFRKTEYATVRFRVWREGDRVFVSQGRFPSVFSKEEQEKCLRTINMHVGNVPAVLEAIMPVFRAEMERGEWRSVKGFDEEVSVTMSTETGISALWISRGLKYIEFHFVLGQIPGDPKKRKPTEENVSQPTEAFIQKINEITHDIQLFNAKSIASLGTILNHDARDSRADYNNAFDMLITSPPYPNNYDYADATRLEMVFWGDITGWGDLQKKVRQNLIHSCSQHTAAEKLNMENILSDPILFPIKDELTCVCEKLEKVRFDHGGKKTYHTMIAAYYRDLAQVFFALRPLMKECSLICFVIGDSAPYGVYAPADEWLGKLALSAGFASWTFDKTRDRNIKWKNRKHTVPLKEGRLWIRG